MVVRKAALIVDFCDMKHYTDCSHKGHWVLFLNKTQRPIILIGTLYVNESFSFCLRLCTLLRKGFRAYFQI